MADDGQFRRPAVHNLYFAIRPDRATGDQVFRAALRYCKAHGLTGQPVTTERLHITLNGLGGHIGRPDGLIARAKDAAGDVRMRRFPIALDRIASWKGKRRPLVLRGGEGVIGASLLHGKIHAALARVGVINGREPDFTPHMTLLRDRRETPDGFIAPVVWTVDEFVLVASPYGERRHDILGRWPLMA